MELHDCWYCRDQKEGLRAVTMTIKSFIYRLFLLFLVGFIAMVVLNNYGVPGPNFRSAQFVSEDLVPIISKVPFGAINSVPHTQVLFRDEIIGAGEAHLPDAFAPPQVRVPYVPTK